MSMQYCGKEKLPPGDIEGVHAHRQTRDVKISIFQLETHVQRSVLVDRYQIELDSESDTRILLNHLRVYGLHCEAWGRKRLACESTSVDEHGLRNILQKSDCRIERVTKLETHDKSSSEAEKS